MSAVSAAAIPLGVVVGLLFRKKYRDFKDMTTGRKRYQQNSGFQPQTPTFREIFKYLTRG